MSAAPYRVAPGALLVDVRLTPKGGRDAIEGRGVLADGRSVLLARVRAAPEKGAANAALEALLADALGRPRSAASVVAGHQARRKTVRVEGDEAALAERLEAILGASPAPPQR